MNLAVNKEIRAETDHDDDEKVKKSMGEPLLAINLPKLLLLFLKKEKKIFSFI
jgi:hypothetical protein